jgi:hypothetical protein
MKTEEIVQRIDSLITKGREALQKGSGSYAHIGLLAGFRSASLSFIQNLYGESHPYFTDFNKQVERSFRVSADAGVNILISIKNEIEQGYILSYKKILSAEVFSDFLEMSKYLLDEGYKDAAAVMIGSVLEEHLRFLCNNHSIGITIGYL